MGNEFRVWTSLEEAAASFAPSAVSIGNFDGVHVAHQRLLRRVVEMGRAHGWKPSVLTFHPHPASVVAPERTPRLLSTPEERAELMRRAGIEQVLILPFDRPFSQQTPEEFVARVLARQLGARAVVVGGNFRFGRDHTGDTGRLVELGRQYGFLAEVVPGVQIRGRMVSSSEVRRRIAAGEVTLAARLLGRPYAISGRVVSGRGVGKRKTVPTLNLATGAEVLPDFGVYVTRTWEVGGLRDWPSVTNVGERPTFGSGGEITIETFLLDPLEGADPTGIAVEFLHHIREERKFASPELLRARIVRDVERARAWHRRAARWMQPVDILDGKT